MKIVSVLLARGGSKEIFMKNIVNLDGHPLIYYTIKASQESNVQETWVSTDHEGIAAVSKDLGTKVLMRPEKLATDHSPSEDALLHFADRIDFDVLVFIQPTSPLLEHAYINAGIYEITNFGFDSVFSAYKENWHGEWTLRSKEALPIGWNGTERPMRQDASPVYIENGAFYVTTKKALLQSKNRYSGKIGIVEMPYGRSFQVDTFDDLLMIQKIMVK